MIPVEKEREEDTRKSHFRTPRITFQVQGLRPGAFQAEGELDSRLDSPTTQFSWFTRHSTSISVCSEWSPGSILDFSMIFTAHFVASALHVTKRTWPNAPSL
jgi:hypothetical protein